MTQDSNKKHKIFFIFMILWFFCIFIIFFENKVWKNKKEKKNFEKDFWKENYLIWATRWTVSCPYSNNPRQRRQKLGGRNCDPCSNYFEMKALLWHWLNSQLRSTNQQVYWVVQVINLTWVRVDPTEIFGMKQAMVTL